MHVWGKRTFAEILNVDKSRDMNQLSQLILQGGQPHKPAMIPNVVYRQFMPHGREVIFICTFVLFYFSFEFVVSEYLRFSRC